MVDQTSEVFIKTVLHWNCRDFKILPEELRNGRDVREIYLKWNNLLSLPIWIKELKNVTNLYLQYNQLEALPEELCELSQLQVLDVTDNKIKLLPKGLNHLSALTHLLAAKNLLNGLPHGFQQLQSLRVLDLMKNKFRSLPESVVECEALEELYIDDNYITTLPDDIVYLPHLSTLSCCGNNLLRLPFQQFSSNPSLCLEKNINLNYLPIWLGDQISAINKNDNGGESVWNLKGTEGCFSIEPGPINLYNKGIEIVSNSTKGEFLLMPQTLKHLCYGPNCPQKVPSLLELSLRMAYKLFHKGAVKIFNARHNFSVRQIKSACCTEFLHTLPLLLQRLLLLGPTVLCYHCKHPIFTFGVIWVVHKDCYYERTPNPEILSVLSVVVFCTVSCSLQFLQLEKISGTQHELVHRKLKWVFRS